MATEDVGEPYFAKEHHDRESEWPELLYKGLGAAVWIAACVGFFYSFGRKRKN